MTRRVRRPYKERLISHTELREFLGEPKFSAWKRLLKEAKIRRRWSKALPRGGGPNTRRRCGLNKNQVRRILGAYYAAVGRRSILSWALWPSSKTCVTNSEPGRHGAQRDAATGRHFGAALKQTARPSDMGAIIGRKDVLPNGKELAVLHVIAELEEELGLAPQLSDVARKYGITRQAVHYWVKRLRKKGLVEPGAGEGHKFGSMAPPVLLTKSGRYFVATSR